MDPLSSTANDKSYRIGERRTIVLAQCRKTTTSKYTRAPSLPTAWMRWCSTTSQTHGGEYNYRLKRKLKEFCEGLTPESKPVPEPKPALMATEDELREARRIIAGRLASEIFARTLSSWNSVYTFRWMGQLGLPAAKKTAEWQHETTVQQFAEAEEYASMFTVDREILIDRGVFAGVAKSLTEQSVDTFEASLDAAALIFTHSVLDGAALDWCRVCAMAEPTDFLPMLGDRRIALRDVQRSTFPVLLNGAIKSYLDNLERESLPKKMDLLFRLCQPPAGFEGVQGYQYDRDRLAQLDQLRHDYVHGRARLSRLPNGDDDLLFLQHTGSFMVPLVHQHYGVGIDPYIFAGGFGVIVGT
jgi:hypothetical protein